MGLSFKQTTMVFKRNMMGCVKHVHKNTNVPLILKYFLDLLEKPIEMADYLFYPHNKITFRTFRISSTLIVKMLSVSSTDQDISNDITVWPF